MKVFAVAVAFLLASVSAMPNQQANELESAIRSGEPKLVTGNIQKAIEDLAESIAEAGLDPFLFEGQEVDYAVPVPTVFNARAHVRDVQSQGLSNIVINRLNYAVLTSRLTFNIELPAVSVGVGDSAWDVNILSGNWNGAFKGSVTVKNIVLTGNIRVSIGILSGISIRDMQLTLDVGSIDSDLSLRLQGLDLSGIVNKYLGQTVHSALKLHASDINELLTIVGRQVVEANL